MIRLACALAVCLALAAGLALAAPAAHAQAPLELIRDALELAAQGEREAALERLARVEAGGADAPVVQYALGKAYEILEMRERAAAWYFRSAKATLAGGGLVLGKRELQALVPELAPPADYWLALRAGRERDAIAATPWWPAAYWVLGMRSRVAGRQSDATLAMRDFAAAMELSGLKGPYREWLLHAEQVRDQVSKLETDFLIEAGLLSPDWNRAARGSAADVARVFGAIEPELWGLSRSAMQYAYRFRSITVSAAGGAEFGSIQAAIDELGRSGGAGVIRVAPGVYAERLLFRDRARIHLRADKPGAVTVRSGGAPALQILGGSRVVVDGLVLESAAPVAVTIEGTSRITLKNGRITASAGRALHVKDADDVCLWRMALSASGSAAVFERSRDVALIGGSARGGAADWVLDASAAQLALARIRVQGGKGGVLVRKAAGEPCQRCSTLAMRGSSIAGSQGYAVAVLGESEAWMVKNVFRQHKDGAVFSDSAALEAARNVVEASGNGFIVRGGEALLRENVIGGARVGISAVGARLEAQANEIEEGETGIEASDSAAVLRDNRVTRQSKAGIFVERPRAGWTIEGNSLGLSETGLVIDAALREPSTGSCFDARAPRIAQNVLYRNTNGMAAGVEAAVPGAGLCVEKNTFVSNAKAGAWLVHKGGRPAVAFSRNIVAFNGGGLLDDAGLARVSDSVAFGNQQWDAFPRLAPAAGGFEAADPQFLDADSDDYRLSQYSPYVARQIGASPKMKEDSP